MQFSRNIFFLFSNCSQWLESGKRAYKSDYHITGPDSMADVHVRAYTQYTCSHSYCVAIDGELTRHFHIINVQIARHGVNLHQLASIVIIVSVSHSPHLMFTFIIIFRSTHSAPFFHRKRMSQNKRQRLNFGIRQKTFAA